MNSGNDSQVTLVSPTLNNEPPLVIVFGQDDSRNIVMKRSGGRGEVLYRVETDKSKTRTSVYDSQSNVPVAVVETKDLFGFDKITIGGGKRQKIRKWISGYGVLQTFPKTFEKDGKHYHWRENIIKQLALYSDDDSAHPIAWYERDKIRVVDGVLRGIGAFIAMEEAGIQIQDHVVLSLLVIESQIRRGEAGGLAEGKGRLL
ncbi:hypothetical protein P691DRAFT_801818 [Macrolepiota fuliginosa MF-IS2]|uniref:DUF6593 domain-containing protein n=1 Tax=Macrolepiota fuliginosa MF-IS2 TaxID=1400762 RepID=A0A9P5WYB9_9AGAR|nr:hypothetical protein P691DRAFT_801818 [Macrolepiota fuliginosa MF-IS2]